MSKFVVLYGDEIIFGGLSREPCMWHNESLRRESKGEKLEL